MIPPLFAIFCFPAVAVILFRTLAPRSALIWCILLGYLFLPTKVGWNLPALPTIDKDTMPALAAIVCLLALSPRTVAPPPLPGWLPRHPVILFLVAGLVLSSFLTVATNGDSLVYGDLSLPGLRLYDGFSAVLSTIMSILPLLLARKYLASEDSQFLIMRALCVAGLIYSLPIIFELLMSPQLNMMVYGFFPHSWQQHVRDGGYRPLVFLQHGLWLGILICVTVLAALGYLRASRSPRRILYLGAAAWLFLLLIAAKSLGAVAIAFLLAPAILFLSMRLQLLVAAFLAGSILLYPALRGAGLIPVNHVVNLAATINPVRASSFQHRLNNEDILLEKANQRPAFGWGGWGRSRIFDEYGRDISTTDGLWVIFIGEKGWLGYLGRFGLLCIPTLILAFRRRETGLTLTTSVLSLILAANLIDLIPNAGLTPVTWMIAGALIGRLELKEAAAEETGTEAGETRGRRLTRFGARHQRPPAAAPLARAESRASRMRRSGSFRKSRYREDSNAF